jgi:hypothetical protein
MSNHKTTAQTKPQSSKLQRATASHTVQSPDSKIEQLNAQQAMADPLSASSDAMLALQRRSGNRAVQRLMRKAAIQAKLTVGPASDRYEQEADRVAGQVMMSPAPAQDEVQRHPGYKEEVQRKPIANTISPLVQRHAKPVARPETEEDKLLAKEEEEGGVQRKAAQPTSAGFEAGADVEQQLASNRGGGRGLDVPVRADMEQRFGADFRGVRVHTDAKAVQLNRALSAHAFTHGHDIYFNQGQYNPASGGGKHLLAHELTHVVQQTGATKLAAKRVQRQTPSIKNGPPTIQRAEKSTSKSVGDWLKRIFIGIPTGLVMAAAGAIVGPIMGGIGGYQNAKDSGKGKAGKLGSVLSGIVGGFVGGIGAGLMAGQKLAVHDPDEGDIAKGDAAPDLRGMDTALLNERVEAIKEKMRVSTEAQADLQIIAYVLQLVDDDTFMQETVQAVLANPAKMKHIRQKGGPDPDNSHIADVRRIVKKHFEPVVDPTKYNEASGGVTVEVGTLPDATPKKSILGEFFPRVRARTKLAVGVTPASTGMFPDEQKYLNPGNGNTAEDAFWAERDQMEMNEAYVPDDQKPGFATALRQMPTVQQILNPELEGAEDRQGTAVWKDGGALHDEGNIDKVNDLVAPKKWMAPKRFNSRSFRNKLQRVDRLTRVVVEPQLLVRAKKPKIKLHATAAASIDAPWGYRANADAQEVNVSYNESSDTIAHEVGHAIERHLPVARWHDVHMLLGARHAAAGGGGLKAGATPIFSTWSEGRFGGKYVTGKYTSRTYSFGNIAEVVAMAMQYFSNPGMAAELIDGDPQHAAIVLRSLQPAEYMSTAPLRRYDKFIPNKKKPPLPPRLSPEKRRALMARGQARREGV